MDQSFVTSAILLLILLLLNGFFAGAEMALVSVRRSALQERADAGSKRAANALAIIEDPSKLLATVQVGITLVGFGASAMATATWAEPLAAWLRSIGADWVDSIATGLAIFIVTLAVSYVTLVIGELVPKRLGLVRAEAFAMFAATPIRWLETLMRPIVWLLDRSTAIVGRLVGLRESDTPNGVSEEEIKMLVSEQGDLLDEEKRMIHEIFDLGDTVAREVMTPRTDAMLLEDTETVERVVDVMRGTGFSRIPIFHEDQDKVVGIAIIKDLLGAVLEGRADEPIIDHMRNAVFVPESKQLLPLLSEMQATRNQMVIVVDEYGGTAGLVTTEDIVEEIVGEIADEFDPDNRYITQLSERELLLDGRLPIEDADRIGIPLPDSEEYETIAGWLLAEMGRIPSVGDVFVYDGFTFKVHTMRRRRISRVHVVMPEPIDDTDGGDDDEREEAL